MSFSIKDIKKEFDFLSEFNFHTVENVPSHQFISYQDKLIAIKVDKNYSTYYDSGLVFINVVYDHRRDMCLYISSDRTNQNIFDKKWYAFYWIIKFLKNDRNLEINHFKEVKNYDQCMRQQTQYLASLLKSNIEPILLFFENEYADKKQDIDTFITNELKKETYCVQK